MIGSPLRRAVTVATALALAPLAACSNGSKSETTASQTPGPASDTLAEALSRQDDLSSLSKALRDTGLSQVFDDSGSYTIFAPTNAAFGKLGDAGKALMQQDRRAMLAALLRDHIVPGYLTPEDIGTAIDAQGGRAKVQTMGDHKLSFTREGKGYQVTAEDGSTAMISGDAVTASDGVAIPVDGFLKKIDPAR